MEHNELVDIAMIVFLGVGSQWLAWRLRLPSILVLLLCGFVAGPITGIVDPDRLLGDLLFPIVSISVAIVLFEGGLTLRFAELPKVGGVIFRLISIGAAVTWGIAVLAAHYILDLDWPLSVLLGAILIVTGPTVVGPLLRQIRPKGQSGNVLKWEGILIDPVGAILAVLVFEVILGGDLQEAPIVILVGVFQTLFIGVVFSVLGAGLFIGLLRRFWIPDQLQNGAALLVAVVTFTVSNFLHAESGLLTVTLLGIFLANQHWVSIKHIVEFKENLRVLLIGGLFILLASRLALDDVIALGVPGILFACVLIFVARPLSVWISTIGSELSRAERIFISWLAPRGIVAASVASIFAFELAEVGHSSTQQLVSVTFFVIVSTVAVYGLTTEILARRLGLSEKQPQGVLIVGGHSFARLIAKILKEQNFRAILVDTNDEHIVACKEMGLTAYHENILSEEALDSLDLSGIGRLIALTSNSEVNALANLHWMEVFGRAEIYQLPFKSVKHINHEPAPLHLTGRYLFSNETTFAFFDRRLNVDAKIQVFPLTPQFDFVAYQTSYQSKAIPLFLITERHELIIYTTDYQPIPQIGQTLISFVPIDLTVSQAALDKT